MNLWNAQIGGLREIQAPVIGRSPVYLRVKRTLVSLDLSMRSGGRIDRYQKTRDCRTGDNT